MSLAPRLDIRQSQSLVMTPQLQQAIKLLALSNLEIEGFIAEEVERNPLLEASAAETPSPKPATNALPPTNSFPAPAQATNRRSTSTTPPKATSRTASPTAAAGWTARSR
jgi:RNA polymerase sigma-54 factor